MLKNSIRTTSILLLSASLCSLLLLSETQPRGVEDVPLASKVSFPVILGFVPSGCLSDSEQRLITESGLGIKTTQSSLSTCERDRAQLNEAALSHPKPEREIGPPRSDAVVEFSVHPFQPWEWNGSAERYIPVVRFQYSFPYSVWVVVSDEEIMSQDREPYNISSIVVAELIEPGSGKAAIELPKDEKSGTYIVHLFRDDGDRVFDSMKDEPMLTAVRNRVLVNDPVLFGDF